MRKNREIAIKIFFEYQRKSGFGVNIFNRKAHSFISISNDFSKSERLYPARHSKCKRTDGHLKITISREDSLQLLFSGY